MPSDVRKFEGRWEFMSGDERVALVESRRAIYGDQPDEHAALRRSFSAHHRALARRAALRDRFLTYRANYLTPPPVTDL